VGHADISPSKLHFIPSIKVFNDQPINIGITVRKNSRHIVFVASVIPH